MLMNLLRVCLRIVCSGVVLLCLLALISFLLVSTRPTFAQSTVLVVTTESDTDDGVCDSDCSLREAIAAASAGDTITFADTVAQVTLISDTLRIDTNLTVDGGDGVIIERSSAAETPDFRIFTIDGTGLEVALDSLTIQNGRAPGDGGGIANIDATLTITNSTISDNQTRDGGNGGGIFNTGTLSMSGSAITENQTGDGSSGGSVGRDGGDGGGIANRGIVTLEQSTLSDNRTGNGGNGSFSSGDGGNGGGIANEDGILSITASTLSGNQTGSGVRSGRGGGILNDGGTVTITSSTISDNQTSSGRGSDGGAIENEQHGAVTITSSTISDNQTGNGIGSDGGNGGAIANEGAVTIINSTLSGNQTGNGDSGGNGIGGDGGNGGAIENLGVDISVESTAASGKNGTLVIINSTLSGNQTGSGDSASGISGSGGNGGAIANEGDVTIINSTLSGNQTGIGGSGGSISGGDGSGGGLFNSSLGTVILANTMVEASARGGDVVDNGDTFILLGTNIIEDGSLESTITGDPQLGPLQDNGGPTLTHKPLPGSPAIDAGDTTLADGTAPLFDFNGDGVINGNDILERDQRGFARVVTSTVDIGAVEVLPPGVTITESDGSTSVSKRGGSDTYTLVLTSQPTATVTIDITPDDTSQVTVTNQLTFTPENWDTLQTVTVTGVADGEADGDQTLTISHSASGGGYDGVTIADVQVIVRDDYYVYLPLIQR
jgi:CSLREA domain-containing protein